MAQKTTVALEDDLDGDLAGPDGAVRAGWRWVRDRSEHQQRHGVRAQLAP